MEHITNFVINKAKKIKCSDYRVCSAVIFGELLLHCYMLPIQKCRLLAMTTFKGKNMKIIVLYSLAEVLLDFSLEVYKYVGLCVEPVSGFECMNIHLF